MEAESLQSYVPLENLLDEREEGEPRIVVALALAVDPFESSLADPIQPLFDMVTEKGTSEDVILALTKYYTMKLRDINLLFRDTDPVTTFWKSYLTPQTDFVIPSYLKRTLYKLARTRNCTTLEDTIPFAEKLLSSLLQSCVEFPVTVRGLWNKTLLILADRFPDVSKKDLSSLLVTATYILRVLCPQIILHNAPRRKSFTFSPRDNKGSVSNHKKFIYLAKLLQLVANNPSDLQEQHSPEIVQFVQNAQKPYRRFCKKLVLKETGPHELRYSCELTEEQKLEDLTTLYKYCNGNRDNITQTLVNLQKDYLQRPRTILDELWDAFLESESFSAIAGEIMESSSPKQSNEHVEDYPLVATFERALNDTKELVGREFLLRSKDSSGNLELFLDILSQNRMDIDLKDPVEYIESKLDPEQFKDKLKWLRKECTLHAFTIIVFYRGAWCPFCHSYLKSWSGFVPLISAMRGAIFSVSTENAKKQNAIDKSGVNIQFISDSECSIGNEYDIETLTLPGRLTFLQPAVIALSDTGKLLYYWKSAPSVGNFFGAADRVAPKDAVRQISNRLNIKSDDNTELTPRKKHDYEEELSS
uniref:Ras-GAP domain-containing protein n=1 Tax=Vannella robusta TaxID=1487602 RepID=A0A7S4HUD4_9EUKA